MASLARRIVNRFIVDLSNRKGFDNLWDKLGQGTRDEIRNEWINIIENIVENDTSK